MYDYLVFIGRFQPFHRAHYGVVKQALMQSKEVILLLGSYESPRTVSNPWTFDEREVMIRACFDESENARIHCIGIHDVPYDDARWVQGVHEAVYQVTSHGARIGLIGHYKDASSYYLSLFSDWGLVSVENIDHINATDIRRVLFELPMAARFDYDDLVAENNERLQKFRQTEVFQRLRCEFNAIKAWKTAWSNTPYPPMFVTVDAFVYAENKVLMVQRKGEIGHGLWALPGGFVEQHETLAEAAVRELTEETSIVLPADSALMVRVFDDPDRSARGRIITHVHVYSLSGELPEPKADDDAQAAQWVDLKQLKRSQCFEDHYTIIETIAALMH